MNGTTTVTPQRNATNGQRPEAASVIDRVGSELMVEHGLPVGTSLENRVTWRLWQWELLDRVQFRVGRYLLDYAWPQQRMALEVDGPHHWRHDVAVRDRARDSFLRAHGWLVFRVDDGGADPDGLDRQLWRVVRLIRAERSTGYRWDRWASQRREGGGRDG